MRCRTALRMRPCRRTFSRLRTAPRTRRRFGPRHRRRVALFRSSSGVALRPGMSRLLRTAYLRTRGRLRTFLRRTRFLARSRRGAAGRGCAGSSLAASLSPGPRCFRMAILRRAIRRTSARPVLGRAVIGRTIGCRTAFLARRSCCRMRAYPLHGRMLRMSVVGRIPRLRISRRRSPLFPLRRRWRVVVLAHGRLFLRSGPRGHTARAVKARVAHRHVPNHSAIDVGVVNHGGVHVHDRGVIAEDVPGPHAAYEPDSRIAEAVIHAAVKAHLRSPVTLRPSVDPVVPAPVARRPQQSRFRWRHPNSVHPVVARVLAPRPVPGLPQVALHRTWRLHVDRQHRRRCVHGDGKSNADLCRRSGRYKAQQQGGQQIPEFQKSSHGKNSVVGYARSQSGVLWRLFRATRTYDANPPSADSALLRFI